MRLSLASPNLYEQTGFVTFEKTAILPDKPLIHQYFRRIAERDAEVNRGVLKPEHKEYEEDGEHRYYENRFGIPASLYSRPQSPGVWHIPLGQEGKSAAPLAFPFACAAKVE